MVIGAGSAGLAAALFAARMGARVALIEAGQPGGDCTWTGCVPSKALLHVAQVVHRATSSGFLTSAGAVEFAAVRAHVLGARERVFAFETPASLEAEGVDLVPGRARFAGPHVVEVNGSQIEGKRFVICTGASPVVPPIPGIADADYLTYEAVWDLEELPGRLLIVGGGPIGSELAQACSRLGSKVTLVEALPRLAAIADPEASEVLTRRFHGEGIELLLGHPLDRVEAAHGELVALVGSARIEAERLLLALGRRPRIDELELDAAGVRTNPTGITIDDRLRTSTPHIFAAGDVTGGPQFTHYAAWQGFAAARNALYPGSTRGRRSPVPWTIFTDPEIAQVGLSEADAEQLNRRVSVHRWPAVQIDRAQTEAETDGFIKLVTAGRKDRLLGATVVSSHAGEVADQLAVAITAGMGLADLAQTLHVYPTHGYGVGQLAAAVRIRSAASRTGLRLLRRLG